MFKYPQEIIEDVNNKSKTVFLIDPPQPYLYDCENCGGMGKMGAFYVTKGPFQSVPPAGDGDEILKSIHDEHYGWLWYRGKDLYFDCPECDGIGGSKKRRPAPMSLREYEEMDKTGINIAVGALTKKMSRKHQLADEGYYDASRNKMPDSGEPVEVGLELDRVSEDQPV